MLDGLAAFGQPLSTQMLLMRIFVAVFIGALIGIDREIKNRPAGMRTHVLVCVGAAIISLIEHQHVACAVQLGQGSLINVSLGRITSTVVSGVGFLGAGTIFISERKITGLTTAASLWCTACIGIAVGAGFVAIGLTAGVIVLIILRLMQRIVHVNTLKKLEVKFIHRVQTLEFLHSYFESIGTIFISERKITGLTTAASLWCTACIGIAVGAGFVAIGLTAGVIVLIILRLMQRIVHVNTLKKLEVKFIHRVQTLEFLHSYFESIGVKVLDVDFHAESREDGNLYTNLYTLSMPSKTKYVDLIATLSEHENIRSVRTRNI